MNFPIIKIDVPSTSSDTTIGYMILEKLWDKKLIGFYDPIENVKLRVSFKNGCRRKLKNVRYKFLGYKTYCECCGPELVVTK